MFETSRQSLFDMEILDLAALEASVILIRELVRALLAFVRIYPEVRHLPYAVQQARTWGTC